MSEPMVRLRGLGRVYGRGAGTTVALRDIDLEVEAGEMVAVAGPSGSGKTTLLNLVGGLDRPTSGRVAVAGRELAGQGESSLAEFRLRRIGFVFQLFHLVPVLSAAENVELPLLFRTELGAAERRERVRDALEQASLREKTARRPAELSGGEQQRVAIARALAGRPALLLADEPTANLDRDNALQVVELMRRLARERATTVLLASHDPEILRRADRRLTLRDGRLERHRTEP